VYACLCKCVCICRHMGVFRLCMWLYMYVCPSVLGSLCRCL